MGSQIAPRLCWLIVVMGVGVAILDVTDYARYGHLLAFHLHLLPWLAPVIFTQVTAPGPLRYTPRRWMQFVDGENLTIRAQRLMSDAGISVKACDHFKKDCFVVPFTGAQKHGPTPWNAEPQPLRAYYYTSLVGDDPY